jgi:hypothetical protein
MQLGSAAACKLHSRLCGRSVDVRLPPIADVQLMSVFLPVADIQT